MRHEEKVTRYEVQYFVYRKASARSQDGGDTRIIAFDVVMAPSKPEMKWLAQCQDHEHNTCQCLGERGTNSGVSYRETRKHDSY
jgi:hypothetical protein